MDFNKIGNNAELRATEEIPLPYQEIFAGYPHFNAVQSQVIDDVLYTDKSLVLSAPTGSGKTAIFELAIIRLLIAYEKTAFLKNLKVVYISPLKALCEEKLIDWHRKFSKFDLNCILVTGDNDVDFHSLLNHNLIITTPEKWDSLTRKWRDNQKLVQLVKLFMIDEVHLLNEENRGATLETIVCRMKTIQDSIGCENDDFDGTSRKIRFIAVSAVIPNIEDIAEWLGDAFNVNYYKFSEDVRPVKLQKLVFGYPSNYSSHFKFDLSLNYKLESLLLQYSEGKPTLIFCGTRKIVEMTAKHILQTITVNLNEENRQLLSSKCSSISDGKLKETLLSGIGYHHAGIMPETRRIIEDLFRTSKLPILVTTSTLAMGVNLPAHLVIIKSTKCYMNGAFQDYTETQLLQMIGRAGRPQFDNTATVLILTTQKDKEKFKEMVTGIQPIESNLHRHLTEHLNAEVVLHTITDLSVAMQWLSRTFLYIRATKNPKHYNLSVNLTKEQIIRKLLEKCQIDINKLFKAGMLVIDENINITPTIIGTLMAKYYMAFETMKLFTTITGHEILQQILGLISKCHEFSEMYLRVNDKKCLNLLNKCKHKQTIRFPLNGKINTLEMKINCIIQAVLGCLDIDDQSILAETLKIMRYGERIAKCFIEFLEIKDNCYTALLNTIILTKCFRAKLWENSQFVCKQLNGIGAVMSLQLVNSGKTTFAKIRESDARQLELIVNRKPPFGLKIIEQVHYLPIYEMVWGKIGNQLKLSIFLKNPKDLQEKSTVHPNSIMSLLIGDCRNQILIYEKYTLSYMIENSEVAKFVDIHGNMETITADFISEDWVGFDCTAKYEFSAKSDPKNSNKEKSNCKNDKDKPYIQQFMDMYMKYKKDPKTKSKNSELENAKVVIKSISVFNPQNKKNDIESENGQFSSKKFEKIAESDPNMEIKSFSNFFNKTGPKNNCPIQNEIFELNEYNNKSPLNESNYGHFSSKKCQKLTEMQNEENFEFSNNKENVENDTYISCFSTKKQPKLTDNTPRNILREECRENNKKMSEINNQSDLTFKFKYQPKKITYNSQIELKSEEIEKPQKITWRSPIIYSPPLKFSPKFEQFSPKTKSTNESKTCLKVNRNLSLTDSLNRNVEIQSLEEICLKTFLEDVGLSKRKTRKPENFFMEPDLQNISSSYYYSQLIDQPKKFEDKKDTSCFFNHLNVSNEKVEFLHTARKDNSRYFSPIPKIFNETEEMHEISFNSPFLDKEKEVFVDSFQNFKRNDLSNVSIQNSFLENSPFENYKRSNFETSFIEKTDYFRPNLFLDNKQEIFNLSFPNPGNPENIFQNMDVSSSDRNTVENAFSNNFFQTNNERDLIPVKRRNCFSPGLNRKISRLDDYDNFPVLNQNKQESRYFLGNTEETFNFPQNEFQNYNNFSELNYSNLRQTDFDQYQMEGSDVSDHFTSISEFIEKNRGITEADILLHNQQFKENSKRNFYGDELNYQRNNSLDYSNFSNGHNSYEENGKNYLLMKYFVSLKQLN